MSRLLITSLMIVLLVNTAWSQQNQSDESKKPVYMPLLEASVSGRVEMGVVTSGTQKTVVITTRKQTLGEKRELVNTLKDVKVSEIQETKTKTTNPNKRKSRPKAGGLFGGVARAFAGDYSGLIEFGGHFVDHMMEPNYDVNLSKTYFIKDYKETTVTNEVKSSWEDKSSFETTITEEYTTDINKGFIKLPIRVVNYGDESVSLKPPRFVVSFVYPDGSSEIIGINQPTQHDDFVVIGSGRPHDYVLVLDSLNLLTLTQKYRDAVGITIRMQDVFLRSGSTQKSITEIQESLHRTHVRLDYFDGRARSVKFFPIKGQGIPIKDFLDLGLSTKVKRFSTEQGEDSLLDRYIVSISGLQSNFNEFSSLATPKDKSEWRRWFISVSDDDGRMFDARLNDLVYPGYSIRIGYYSADQILPFDLYRPIVYEQKNVRFMSNERIHIPFDLREGDVLSLEDVKFEGININTVTFRVSPVNLQTFDQTTRSPQYTMPVVPPSHLLVIGNSSSSIKPEQFTKTYLIEPLSNRFSTIDEKNILKVPPTSSLDESLQKLMVRIVTLELMKKSFTHVDGIQKLFETGASIEGLSNVIIKAPAANANDLLQGFYPNESLDSFLNRQLRKAETLNFVIEKNVNKNESYWLFFNPSLGINSGVITTSETLPNEISGDVMGNFMNFALMEFLDLSQNPIGLVNTTSFDPFFNNLALSSYKANALLALRKPDGNYMKPYRFDFLTTHKEQSLSNRSGPVFTATIRVIRDTP